MVVILAACRLVLPTRLLYAFLSTLRCRRRATSRMRASQRLSIMSHCMVALYGVCCRTPSAIQSTHAQLSSMRSATLCALAGGDASASLALGERERFRALRSASPRGRLAAGASADSSACLRTAAPACSSACAGGLAGSRAGNERIKASTRAALPKGVGRPQDGRAMDARCVLLRGMNTNCARLTVS